LILQIFGLDRQSAGERGPPSRSAVTAPVGHSEGLECNNGQACLVVMQAPIVRWNLYSTLRILSREYRLT